jgi:hypothetical protein
MANLSETSMQASAPPSNSDELSSELGMQLVRMGKLTPIEAARAAARARVGGLSFPEAAVAMGFLGREELMKALSLQYSYPFLDGSVEAGRFSRELVVSHEPFSSAAEAIR